MPEILPIAHLGHNILRIKASKVEDINENDFLKLLTDMMATVKDAQGLGISAPQVYSSKRVFIMASKPSPRSPNAPEIRPFVVINPTILNYSEEKTKAWEGCLSIPGIRGYVTRNKSITVEYTSENGENIVRNMEGFVARIFQHEYDHLNGKVFLDQLENNKDIISEQEYQKMFTS